MAVKRRAFNSGSLLKIILLGIFLSLTAFAAPDSNWSKSSTWTPSKTTTQKLSAHSNDLTSEASPFAPGSHNISLDLGQVFLMGDLNKYNDSIGGQLHYTYGVSELFGFDSNIGYSEHSEGRFSMISALTGLRMNLAWYDKVVPYVVFGLGFYRPSYRNIALAEDPGNTTSLSSILFGVHLGPGVDLELTRNLFFGAGLTFHTLFGATKTLSDGSLMNIGGTYTSFLLRVGITF